MIALVASATDSNAAVSAATVAVQRPVGVLDGDIVIFAVATESAPTTVTPPDDTWTLAVETDPRYATSLKVYWKTALNEPVNWVFRLSTSQRACGAAVVYRGLDPFNPVESVRYLTHDADHSHPVAGASTSLSNEEVLLFGAMDGGVTNIATVADGLLLKRATAGATLFAERFAEAVPGEHSYPNFTDSTSTHMPPVFPPETVTAAIVLAPAEGTTTYDDAYGRLLRGMPPGVEQILDFTKGSGDFYYYFWVMGAMLKTYGYDLIDTCRREVVPYLSRYVLARWESVLGLLATSTARRGTIAQRQAQVLAAWRGAAGVGASVPEIQAILAPLLGYDSAADVRVMELARATLTPKHLYPIVDFTETGAGTYAQPAVYVYGRDGGAMSDSGVQVNMTLDADTLEDLTFTLTYDDGAGNVTTKSWLGTTLGTGALVDSDVQLFGKEFAGDALRFRGHWTLTVVNAGAGSFSVSNCSLFFEGILTGHDTGGAIYNWGVYADPAHLGENGTAPDFDAARLAIFRLSPPQAVGRLILSIEAYPATTSGAHTLLPASFTPGT